MDDFILSLIVLIFFQGQIIGYSTHCYFSNWYFFPYFFYFFSFILFFFSFY